MIGNSRLPRTFVVWPRAPLGFFAVVITSAVSGWLLARLEYQTAAILFLGIPLIASIFRYPLFGLLVFILLRNTPYPLDLLPAARLLLPNGTPFLIGDIVLIATLFAALVSIFKDRSLFTPGSRMAVPALLLALWLAFTLVQNHLVYGVSDARDIGRSIVRDVLPLGLAFITPLVVCTKRSLKSVVGLIIGLGVINALFQIYLLIFNPVEILVVVDPSLVRRPLDESLAILSHTEYYFPLLPGRGMNFVGLLFSLSLMSLGGLPRSVRRILSGLSLLLMATYFLSITRSGWVLMGASVGLLVVLLYWRRGGEAARRLVRPLSGIIGVALLALVVLLLTPSAWSNAVLTKWNQEESSDPASKSSLGFRILAFSITLEDAGTSPLLGHGLEVPQFSPGDVGDLLVLALKGGVPAVLLGLWTMYRPLRALWLASGLVGGSFVMALCVGLLVWFIFQTIQGLIIAGPVLTDGFSGITPLFIGLVGSVINVSSPEIRNRGSAVHFRI